MGQHSRRRDFHGQWGGDNTANDWYATVGGGYSNTVSGEYAAVAGGYGNVASGLLASVPGGYRAAATQYGQVAHGSGAFVVAGDAQTSVYVLRNTSYSDGYTELFLDGASRRLSIAQGRALTFDILVIALSSNGGTTGFRVEGVIVHWG